MNLDAIPFPALLFCPADRAERYAKAAVAADGVILDLEDGVGADDKAAARIALIANPLDPQHTIVRISPFGTDDHLLDLKALANTSYRMVMLAKTESAQHVRSLQSFEVVALCETPRGVLAAQEIAAVPNTVALMWGAEDLVASLNGRSSRRADGTYRAVALHARSAVLLAAGASGKAAIDSVYLDIHDHDGLRTESIDAAASGFFAKASIHPAQMPVIREAFAPTADELDRARRILAAARANDHGVFAFEGSMVDAPVLRHAERVVRAAPADDGDRR
jgi:citrate lyase subunit beta/citryl-CoA lyase